MPEPAPKQPKSPDQTDRADAETEIGRRFEAARAADAALAGAEAGAVLRHVPGKRAVLRGRLDGRAAVFRMTLDSRDDGAAREWAEMCRLWPFMNSGRYRIAEPLHCAAAHGLVVTAEVPGRPLMKHLWKSPPETRARHLVPAATWLRRATEISEGWQPAGVRGWLSRAERAAAQQPFAVLRRPESAILIELRRLGALLEGTEWRCAIGHGDMHPNNLIIDRDRLTGIDLGGSARMPVYKDMARFLVHMGRRGLIPSGSASLGVDAQGLAAFADVFDLTDRERRLALPFMIGIEALIRVESRNLPRARIRHAQTFSEALLRDLRETGTELNDL